MDVMELVNSAVALGVGLLLLRMRRGSLKLAYEAEQHGYHAQAVVREYRREHVRVAGSWQYLDYPYVEYSGRDGEKRLERLKYAQSPGRPFPIGAQVEVVRYDGVLYYRSTLLGSEYVMLALGVGALVSASRAVLILKSATPRLSCQLPRQVK